MNIMKLIHIIIIFIFFYSCSSPDQQNLWKGSAIIGNGQICAVYSDDNRLVNKGIQHFYFKNYTTDYISSSSCEIFLENGSKILGKKSIGMANFYTTYTKYTSQKNIYELQANSFPNQGLIISIIKRKGMKNSSYKYKIHFRKNIKTNKLTHLESADINKEYSLLKWNNNVSINVISQNSSAKANLSDSILTLAGQLLSDTTRIIINATDKFTFPDSFRSISQPNYWENWIQSGVLPEFENITYLDYYRRNLYAAKAANLSGMIPADITGQFITNNMPQLYPRDAMMIARVFIKTGHWKDAKQIIKFWADERIPRKSKGEWYARYDAFGKAVDAGTGARYDEPEWDANAYIIQLLNMYHKATGEWLLDSLQIYETADFLVNKLDNNNLLFEGGIIEWSGYLPATNMTASAALKTVAEMATNLGNNQKSNLYIQVAKKIDDNLTFMFDKKRNTYADVRFTGQKKSDNSSFQSTLGDTLYLWNTSSIFGILWGYPDHQAMQQTNEFYEKNTVKFNGGVQYFNAPDQGLASYGNDMFFFTTAARAQYLALSDKLAESQKHINWMIHNCNIYGLMPERIYLNNLDCSDASPLSWCCAEFAAALLELHEAMQRNF